MRTYGIPVATPCHGLTIWLVWRRAAEPKSGPTMQIRNLTASSMTIIEDHTPNRLVWRGVPCPHGGCANTFAVALNDPETTADAQEIEARHVARDGEHGWAVIPAGERAGE